MKISDNIKVILPYFCFFIFYIILMLMPSSIEIGIKRIIWNVALDFPLIIGFFLSVSLLTEIDNLGNLQKILTVFSLIITIVSINFSLILLFVN